jgi:hypothetical protein
VCVCVWLGGCAEKRKEEEEREEREEEERLEQQRAEHARAVARKELRQSLHWVRVLLSRARMACCADVMSAGIDHSEATPGLPSRSACQHSARVYRRPSHNSRSACTPPMCDCISPSGAQRQPMHQDARTGAHRHAHGAAASAVDLRGAHAGSRRAAGACQPAPRQRRGRRGGGEGGGQEGEEGEGAVSLR